MTNKEKVKNLVGQRKVLPYYENQNLIPSYFIQNGSMDVPNDRIDWYDTSLSIYGVTGWNDEFEAILKSEYENVYAILYSPDLPSIIFTPTEAYDLSE